MAMHENDILFQEWIARARQVDVLEAAQRHGAILKKKGAAEWAGPCPACGGTDRFSVNTSKQKFNCRGFGGGRVVSMVMHIAGLDFLQACEGLTGEPPPRGPSTMNHAEIEERREKLQMEAAEREARRTREQAAADEKRRTRAWELFQCGVRADNSVVARYLEARGIDPRSPATRRLRLLLDAPYWYEIDGYNRVIHTGPAMMAAIQGGDRHFMGVHLTWLADDGLDKARLLDPDGNLLLDEKGQRLKTKKFRGLPRGGAIRLTGDEPGDILLVGEGIETTLTAYDALTRRRQDLSIAAWAAASLGNLGGGGTGSEPDMDNPGFLPPEWAKRVVILGDGDSDPIVTRNQTERARRRCARLGIPAAVAMAAPGMDFNDMLGGA